MRLTREQVDALADRFDDIAFSVSGALDAISASGVQFMCDRLRAICNHLAPAAGSECEDEVSLHFVASLLAAIEIRCAPGPQMQCDGRLH